MGRGYLDGGVWKEGWFPPALQSSPSFLTDKLDHSHKYHLYAANVCPFAHSANISRILTGLSSDITVSNLEPAFGAEGWTFGKHTDPHHPDFKYLHQVYTRAKKDYTGRVSVPVLYDLTLDTIVCNESLALIELFSGFGKGIDLVAPAKDPKTTEEFTHLKNTVITKVNAGCYAAGLAKTQESYDKAVTELFATFDELDARLASSRYLLGNLPSLPDVRLFVSYLRFVYVYRVLFRLDKKNYIHYKNLNRFLLEFYETDGIQSTINISEIKEGYYTNFNESGNATIIPAGPDFDLNAEISV